MREAKGGMEFEGGDWGAWKCRMSEEAQLPYDDKREKGFNARSLHSPSQEFTKDSEKISD
jgi:hypothetical protein